MTIYPYTYQYTGEPWPPPESWRKSLGADKAVLIPTMTLTKLSDPARVEELARRYPAYLASLETDIQENGLREVLEVVVDGRGRIRVRNGHHRIIVAERLSLPILPVVITPVEAIRGWARPIAEVLSSLLPTALNHDSH